MNRDDKMWQGVRIATHAGSWYDLLTDKLDANITRWLAEVPPTKVHAKAVIVPHAGYKYCGRVAAEAYGRVDGSKIERVIILGPSHKQAFFGCKISGFESMATPLWTTPIDWKIKKELLQTGRFGVLDKGEDEDEHSIEMTLPFLQKIIPHQFTVVPILVGSVTPQEEAMYGSLLSKYLKDPTCLFVISSDFCHWGAKFGYIRGFQDPKPIWQTIEDLDKEGMKAISQIDPEAFEQYLKRTKNTICGRYPISIFLKALVTSQQKPTIEFVKYAQSAKALTERHWSVSYASAICY